MMTTAKPRPAPPAPAPIAAEPTGAQQLAALIAELKADQDADIAELRAEIAELRALIAKPEPTAPSWAPPGYEPLKAVAARLGYACETVRLWCASGAVDARRRGGQWFVEPASAEEYARTR
jgi:hypothetical protein